MRVVLLTLAAVQRKFESWIRVGWREVGIEVEVEGLADVQYVEES